MKIILGFYFHDGEKYCYDCARYKRPVRQQYQVVQIVGPIQINNWQKIDGQHRCVSCGSVPYFFNGRDPALRFRCRCVVWIPIFYFTCKIEVWKGDGNRPARHGIQRRLGLYGYYRTERWQKRSFCRRSSVISGGMWRHELVSFVSMPHFYSGGGAVESGGFKKPIYCYNFHFDNGRSPGNS